LSNFASPQSVDPSEWVKFEVVFLIKPRTFEELQRQPSPSGEGEGVDGQLYVGVRFFSCIRLVVEDMQVTIPDLEEINVAGDDLSLEVEGELVMAVIGEIGCRGARRICRSW